MNTIKSQNGYLLRDAVKATPEEYPQLCRVFRDIKKKYPCGRRLSLMVGESNSAGMAIKRSRCTGVILIDWFDVSRLTEKQMRFLIGHEVAHFIKWHEVESRVETPELYCPPHQPLVNLYWSICSQIDADLVGVAECRSAFSAAEYLSDGDPEMEELYNNPLEPLTEKFNSSFELAIRIKALGLLDGTEYFYELLNSELFGYGRWAMTTEEYHEKMKHLFDPFLNFTDEEGRILGAFMAGALFIVGCRVGDVRWYRELDLLDDYGEPAELLAFSSTDEAYERMKSVADNVHSINHPLKHIAIGVVENAVYHEWADDDAADKLEDFLSEMIGRVSSAA